MRTSTGICSGGSRTCRARLRPLHDRLERREQTEQVDLELRFVLVAGDVRDAFIGTLPLRGAQLLALVEQFRRRLELLVLDQAPHEQIARVLFLAVDVRRRLGPRQQHLRLDVDERRGHHQELPGDIEIEILHQLNASRGTGRVTNAIGMS